MAEPTVAVPYGAHTDAAFLLEHIPNADRAAQGGLVTNAAFRRDEEPLCQEHLHAATGANGQ